MEIYPDEIWLSENQSIKEKNLFKNRIKSNEIQKRNKLHCVSLIKSLTYNVYIAQLTLISDLWQYILPDFQLITVTVSLDMNL